MMITLVTAVALILFFTALVLGLLAPTFAWREIWKALGLWGLGLGAGIGGMVQLFVLIQLRGAERSALRAAGKHVQENDMPGFGEAMLGYFGLMYFAAVLWVIFGVFVVSLLRRGRS
jgi:hypothetical protein